MPKRRTPPQHLTQAFHQEAMSWYLHGEPGVPDAALRHFDGGPACWLYQFDPFERPCSGELQAIHFLSRQRIRNVLRPLLLTDLWADGAIDPIDVDDLVELAEWDPRNAGPGCTGHHVRFDSQATPALRLPLEGLPHRTITFLADWALDQEAERKFDAPLAGVRAGNRSGLHLPDSIGGPAAQPASADSGENGTEPTGWEEEPPGAPDAGGSGAAPDLSAGAGNGEGTAGGPPAPSTGPRPAAARSSSGAGRVDPPNKPADLPVESRPQ